MNQTSTMITAALFEFEICLVNKYTAQGHRGEHIGLIRINLTYFYKGQHALLFISTFLIS